MPRGARVTELQRKTVSSIVSIVEHQKAIDHFRRIAIYESTPAKGSFLYAFLEAFKRADNDNALILLPAMRKICRKYHFEGRIR
jgi:hypothetical protein